MISNFTIARIRAALEEDIGTGDVTSSAIFADNARATAEVIAVDGGVVAGCDAFAAAFRLIDPAVSIQINAVDGAKVPAGTIVATLAGSTCAILAGERVGLNLYSRLSGIATLTRRFVDAIAGTQARILDTRKTTPGWRELERLAVRAGGGTNHRTGLYDMVLIKDNHVAAAGGIAPAIKAVRDCHGTRFPIEVETQNLDEVREAAASGVDYIMLDNMSLEMMREAVGIIAGRAQTEASGRVNLDNVRQVAETGVDRISIGALTHSFRVLDLSLEINLHSRTRAPNKESSV